MKRPNAVEELERAAAHIEEQLVEARQKQQWLETSKKNFDAFLNCVPAARWGTDGPFLREKGVS